MSDVNIQRNRLIAGLVILSVVIFVLIYSLFPFLPQRTDRPQFGYRNLIATLAHCGPGPARLCVDSFAQQVDGSLQVNFLVPNEFYPVFLLKIIHDGEESTYRCEKVEAAPTSMICTGPSQAPGQILQFKVFFKNGTALAAEGSFAIIGIALMTPGVDATATIEGTGTPPSETPTPTRTPLAFPATRTATPTPPLSYPNPTVYPNPSYP